MFTKCKESLQEGRRLENISWRLWYREMMLAGEVAALRRSPSAEGLVVVLVEDEKQKNGDVWSPESSELSVSSSPSLIAPPPDYSSSSSSMVSLSSSSMSSLLRGSCVTFLFFPFRSFPFLPFVGVCCHSFIHLLVLFVFVRRRFIYRAGVSGRACKRLHAAMPCHASSSFFPFLVAFF